MNSSQKYSRKKVFFSFIKSNPIIKFKKLIFKLIAKQVQHQNSLQQQHKPLERTIANSFGSSSTTSSNNSNNQLASNHNQLNDSQSQESDDCSPPPTPPIRQRLSRPNHLPNNQSTSHSFHCQPSTSGTSLMAPLATPDHELSAGADHWDQCSSGESSVDELHRNGDNDEEYVEDEGDEEEDDDMDVPPSFVSETEVFLPFFGNLFPFFLSLFEI